MGRFMYIHFGDDVPRNIEKEYNKLLRKERYLEERDAENGMIYPDFDAVLAANPDPASIPISEEEEQEQIRQRNRHDYLPNVINLKRLLNGKQNVWKYQNGEEKSDSDGREKDV